MVKEYRPVFNRTYLKILPWVVAIAIVLLTAKGVKDSFHTPEQFQESNLYSFHHEEQEADVLRLILAFPEPALEQDKAHHLTFQKALLASSQEQPDISATWFKDRLQLDISATRLKQERLSDLLEDLYKTSQQYQVEFKTEAAAEVYLQSQDIEELALTNFRLQLNQRQSPQLQTGLTDRIRTAILLTKDKQPELIEKLAEQLPAKTAGNESKSVYQAHEVRLTSRGNNHLLLTGTTVAPDEQDQYRLLLPLLSELLKQFKSQSSFNYRLLLESEFAALIIKKETPFSDRPTQKLADSFNKRLSEEDLHAIIKQLIKAYKQRLESPDKKTQLFSDQLFYQQPFKSADAFSDNLNAISLDDLKESLSKLLHSDQTIQILIQPHE